MVKMVRSIVGVIAGYFVFVVSTLALFRLSGRDPHEEQGLAFLAFSIAFGMAAACAGGFLAGVIAGRSPRVHGAAAAIVLASGAIASILAQPGGGSRWSQLSAIFLMAPAAYVGGLMGIGQQRSS